MTPVTQPPSPTPESSSDIPELGWTKDLDLPFDEARTRVESELKQEGFGILTEIPVHQKLEEKLGITDFPRYEILGACNPPMANQALRSNRDVGLLMPCNVTLEQVNEGTTRVSIARPESLLLPRFGDDATICGLAEAAQESLEAVYERL